MKKTPKIYYLDLLSFTKVAVLVCYCKGKQKSMCIFQINYIYSRVYFHESDVASSDAWYEMKNVHKHL